LRFRRRPPFNRGEAVTCRGFSGISGILPMMVWIGGDRG